MMTEELRFDWNGLWIEVEEDCIKVFNDTDILLRLVKPGPYHCADHTHLNIVFPCRDSALGYESERVPFSVDIDLNEVARPALGPDDFAQQDAERALKRGGRKPKRRPRPEGWMPKTEDDFIQLLTKATTRAFFHAKLREWYEELVAAKRQEEMDE